MASLTASDALYGDMAAQTVLGYVPRGRDAAVPLSSIAETLNWPRRSVEQAVQDLRSAGFPVCSGSGGIWWGDERDLEQTLRSLRGRLISQYATYKALQRTLRRMKERQQQTLFDAA